MNKKSENRILVFVMVMFSIVVMPFLSVCQAQYEALEAEYNLCPECDWEFVDDGVCYHCGYVEKDVE